MVGIPGSTFLNCPSQDRARHIESLQSGAWLSHLAMTSDSRYAVLGLANGAMESWDLRAPGRHNPIVGPAHGVSTFVVEP